MQLAGAYYHGCGVKKDIEKANHYLQLAAQHGHPEARKALGIPR
jgi:TPR repeat protein